MQPEKVCMGLLGVLPTGLSLEMTLGILVMLGRI